MERGRRHQEIAHIIGPYAQYIFTASPGCSKISHRLHDFDVKLPGLLP